MKKISLFLILLLLFTCNLSYAGIGTDIGDALFKDDPGLAPIEGVKAAEILSVMQWVGYAIAIGMIIFCGIKFVMTGAGEKAKVKETLIPIVIGSIILASAVTITEAAFTMFGK